MSPISVLNVLRENGHAVSLIEGQLKVLSQRRLAPDLLDLLTVSKLEIIHYVEWKAMSEAIEAVEATYRPHIEDSFSDDQRASAARLNNMPINSIADVNRWKAGWLALLKGRS